MQRYRRKPLDNPREPLMTRRLKALAIGLLSVLMLAACGPIDSLKDGMAHSAAVSADLEKSLGLKSFVGFNWNNGALTNVNVTFQGLPDGVPLATIAEKSKEAVVAEFKQTPKQIVIAFAIEP
ncbi:hypothetical protein [Pelomonas sp. KK5]|uniref:hypothetical protein n=1 Tax=Pelomonas sp. KK5 TaxID=1855730 RepID=UPI001180F871|nr:hypothetical protein [Pelomonas sp. KK5]